MIAIPLWEVIHAHKPCKVMVDSLGKGNAFIGEDIGMDKTLRVAVYHLLHVWKQYNSWGCDEQRFSHACMTAGEDATEFLCRLGLGDDQGRSFEPNEACITLMQCDVDWDSGLLVRPESMAFMPWDETILGDAPAIVKG